VRVTPCYPIWNWWPYPRILGLFTYRNTMRSMFGWSGGPRGLPASSVLWSWKGPRNDGAQSDILRGTQWWIPERYLPWYQCASIKQLPDLDNLDDLGHLDILDPVCSMVPECVAELGRFWLNVGKCSEPWSIGEQSHTQQEPEQLLKMIGSMVPLPK
jgi:hypothetical protein